MERLFANLITDGTSCSAFESEIIVDKAEKIFAIGDHAEGNILQPGQMIWTAVDANEPACKPLKCAQNAHEVNKMDFLRDHHNLVPLKND